MDWFLAVAANSVFARRILELSPPFGTKQTFAIVLERFKKAIHAQLVLLIKLGGRPDDTRRNGARMAAGGTSGWT